MVERLKQRAERNRRSLEAEVRAILEELSEESKQRRVEDFLKFADAIRSRSGLQQTDSVDLVREDRDNPAR